MLIVHKKQFNIGLLMTISFFIVLSIMFMPLFSGHNAFVAADRLFNSISKASTDYSEGVNALIETQRGKEVTLRPKLDSADRQALAAMLAKVGVNSGIQDETLVVSGDLGVLLGHIVQDARLMFNNQGEQLEQAYGMAPRKATYLWWRLLKASEKNLKDVKEFKTAAVIGEVIAKSVEVGYNYFGVEPQPARQHAGILTFSLVFYVIYTLWWGFAIFFLAEGVGLAMTKGAKKEV